MSDDNSEIRLFRAHYPLLYRRAKAAFEREYLITVLRLFNGNISKAAKAMRLNRRNLQRKIQELKVTAGDFAKIPSE